MRQSSKHVFRVRTLKLRTRDAAAPVEHTFREVARTEEEARAKIQRLPLVVEVLDVTRVDSQAVHS